MDATDRPTLQIDRGEYYGDHRYERVTPKEAVEHLVSSHGQRDPVIIYPAMGGPIEFEATRTTCPCGGTDYLYALKIKHDYWQACAVMGRRTAADIVALMVAMHSRGSIHIDDFVAMRDGKLPHQAPEPPAPPSPT